MTTKSSTSLLLAGLLMAAVGSATANAQPQVVLYENGFEADAPGPGLPGGGVFEFHGPDSLVIEYEVTDTDGMGGSNSFKSSWDSTASAADFFYFAGIGQFSVFADDANPLGNGVPQSNDPANYEFSADVQLMGHLSNTPIEVFLSAIDADYEATFNVDVNEDMDFEDGAAVWTKSIFPTIDFANNDYVHVSTTLDTDTPGTDDNVLAPFFDNSLSLQWLVAHNNGGFGFGANKMMSIDNVRFALTVPEPASCVLAGFALAGLVGLVGRHRIARARE